MKRLQGVALTSHLRSKAKKDARRIDLAKKRNAIEKMQSVYSEYKNVSRLEWTAHKVASYVGIAKDALKIAFYGAPVVVLTAGVVRAIFWILF